MIQFVSVKSEQTFFNSLKTNFCCYMCAIKVRATFPRESLTILFHPQESRNICFHPRRSRTTLFSISAGFTRSQSPCRFLVCKLLKDSQYNFYRATACNATQGIAVRILSVRLSVRPSVRCVYCDKTNQRTANILIPHETAITLVF